MVLNKLRLVARRARKTKNRGGAHDDKLEQIGRRFQQVSQIGLIALGWTAAATILWQEITQHSISNAIARVTPAQVQILGVKVDLERRDTAITDALHEQAKLVAGGEASPVYDPDLTLTALRRARALRPTLQGARVLWLDPNPQNNTVEQYILEDLGVHVTRATSIDQALDLLKSAAPFGQRHPEYRVDAVISYVGRPDREKIVPSTCAIAFYAPLNSGPPLRDLQARQLKVAELNAATMNGEVSPGYIFAERLAASECPNGEVAPCSKGQPLGRNGAYLTYRAAPRIIFYSASNGGAVLNACGRTVTNRVNVLVDTVVTVLEESRGVGEVLSAVKATSQGGSTSHSRTPLPKDSPVGFKVTKPGSEAAREKLCRDFFAEKAARSSDYQGGYYDVYHDRQTTSYCESIGVEHEVK